MKSRVIWGSLAAMAAAAVSLLVLSACRAESKPAVAASAPQLGLVSAKDFSPRRFDRTSSVVDNAWFPLKPGMQLVFEGSAVEEGERFERSAIWTVTDLVKEIGGVHSAVVWERDIREGELVEAELALFAQDKAGTVWHLGQYPEEYEEGKFVAAPTWFHGIKGAKAGIAMHANPRVKTPDYAQGFAPPPISWVDRGKVHRQNVKTCVPTGCYAALVIREFEPNKPGASQLKYYARGIGNIRVGWMGDKDQDKEELRLVKIIRLNPAQLAKARNAALKLEAHAYKVSKNVYGKTAPMTTTR